MSGKKGRSGRRPWSIEEKRHRIIDKSYDVVGEALNDRDFTLMDKVMIAEKVVTKDIGRNVNVTGETTHIVKMGTIEIDGKPLEVKVGD